MTPDVNVILINFPGPEREAVTHNEDGSYTIFINARLSSEGQLRAYEHAMKHIEEDDFAKNNVQQIEVVAHELAKQPEAQVMSADEIQRRIKNARRRRRKIQRQMQADKERVEFLREHCDMSARAEHYYLYGNDL